MRPEHRYEMGCCAIVAMMILCLVFQAKIVRAEWMLSDLVVGLGGGSTTKVSFEQGKHN